MSTVLAASALLNVRAGRVVSPGYVVVDGGKVTYAGTKRPQRGDSADWRDLGGLCLIPGLIDCHVHLCFNSESEDCVADLMRQTRAQLRQAMMVRAKTAARRGITTVRDVGDRYFIASELARQNRDDLPTIISSGPPLTSKNGHCHFLGGEVQGENDAISKIFNHWQHGVALIKIMVNGGILTASSDVTQLQFTQPLLDAMVAYAHSRGRLVAAHAHTASGIRAALDAGVDTIEHCTFGTRTEFFLDQPLVAELAKSKVWISPTFVERPDVNWHQDRLKWRRHVLMSLFRAGVPIVAGTDCGVIQGLHHDSLPWALISMSQLGIPPANALQAGTVHAAEACGVAGRKGRISPGLDADIVGVHGDPLQDLTALLRPEFVMMRGNIIA